VYACAIIMWAGSAKADKPSLPPMHCGYEDPSPAILLVVVLAKPGSFVLFNVYGVAISGEDPNHERRTLKMAIFKVLTRLCQSQGTRSLWHMPCDGTWQPRTGLTCIFALTNESLLSKYLLGTPSACPQGSCHHTGAV